MSEERAVKIQQLAAELQSVAQQLSSLESQVRELEGTIGALEIQPEDKPVYRQRGPLLLEVHDRKDLLLELQETLATISSYVERISEDRDQIQKVYDSEIEAFEQEG